MFGWLGKRRKPAIHFLHIGKTGGSAIKHALQDYTDTPVRQLILHGHRTRLMDIPAGEPVVFFLREPVSRFISGFYSRQRQGMPRRRSAWSPLEASVFSAFTTPGDLASALADKRSAHHALATRAMDEISHLSHYSRWIGDTGAFEARIGDILFIGFQESLDADFERLRQLLELPGSARLPEDDVSAHRNPPGLDQAIPPPGLQALEHWYDEDVRCVARCRQLMADRALSGGPGRLL